MIADIAAAVIFAAALAVCAWTWLLGRRARRRIAQATIRDLAPGHPAGRRIRPEDPRLREPLSEAERTAFGEITGESQPRRRVLVARTPMIAPSGADGEFAPEGAHERPSAAGVVWPPPPGPEGRKEDAGTPGALGGPGGPRVPPNPRTEAGSDG